MPYPLLLQPDSHRRSDLPRGRSDRAGRPDRLREHHVELQGDRRHRAEYLPSAVTTAFSVPAGVALGPAANEADLPCYFDATFGDYYGPGYSWWELPFDSYADYNSVWCSKASPPSFAISRCTGDTTSSTTSATPASCFARQGRARPGSLATSTSALSTSRTGVDYVLDKTVPAGSVGNSGQTPSWGNYLAQGCGSAIAHALQREGRHRRSTASRA